MRVKTPEISWHDTTPVYSCDYQPLVNDGSNEAWVRLATCGRDNMIRVWKIPETTCKPQFLACLRRHDKPVNVVRFIPTGEDILASGSDDGLVVLWKREASSSSNAATSFGDDDDEEECCEQWQVNRVLRRHLEDVYDLSWSADGQCLISGSVDHSAIEWNLKSGQQLLLKDHKQYVQGVAWDPRDEYVLSMGSDRSCRVYRVGSRNCSYNIVRHEKQRLFQDDSWKSFFRRLTFSPDGTLLICPAGCHGNDGHSAYVFTRQSMPTPVLALPTESRPVVAVRFCPTPFQLPKECTPLFALPYMWVFCLVLEDGILVYNTISKYPIAYVGAIHYQTLNDATWSLNGRMLVTCSTDGYCSVVQFDPNELGRPYVLDKSEKIYTLNLLSVVPEKVTVSTKSNSRETDVESKIKEDTKANSTKCVNDKDDNAKESQSLKPAGHSKSPKDTKTNLKSNQPPPTASVEMAEDVEMIEPETNAKDEEMEMDTCESEKESSVVKEQKPAQSSETLQQVEIVPPSEDSPLPAKKKRRVTFVTLGNSDEKTGEPMEISVGVASHLSEKRISEEDKDEADDVPRKRRVAITTISNATLGDNSQSPLQVMKRRVAFTTISSQVCPDEINDNLSNMSAPEFNLTLDDSMSEKKDAGKESNK